jgi:hypothetical protein
MRVFARHSLVPDNLPPDVPALLLEGDWPAHDRPNHQPVAQRWSLDREIDARHAWIDRGASELAERLADDPAYRLAGAESRPEASLAWINALALRYYVVKLLRIVAMFESPALSRTESLCLSWQPGVDEEYRCLIGQIAASRGWDLRYEERLSAPRTAQPAAGTTMLLLRRLAGALNRRGDAVLDWLGARHAAVARKQSGPILLCGNPRVLAPVCRELCNREMPVVWLYQRFAFGNWLAWRRRGVRQWVCELSDRQTSVLTDKLRRKLLVRGVDLAPAVEVWLDRIAGQRATTQQQLWDNIERCFDPLRPAALVVDEDATPLKRMAIAVARHNGAASLVVQHGAPRVRFGFAPLAADRFLAWGEASRRQLTGWGVAAEQIIITGSPRHWPKIEPCPKRRSILLMATTPPRDARPDAVEYHLTRQTHDDLIHLACAAVARLGEFELAIKLHPRMTDRSLLEAMARSHPGLRYRIVEQGSWESHLAEAACVLNCGSSAGIEAACYGWPVIELLPAGSIELTPADRWGMLGAASTAEQLDRLLKQALGQQQARRGTPRVGEVFAAFGDAAARQIADAIVTATTPASGDELPKRSKTLAEAAA